MFFPEDIVSEVKALNDIVDVVAIYVRLTPRSGNHFGLCPFHGEKTPSFSVNRDKQIFYCFGCGAGGNVISFIRRMENMDFPEAVRFLADRVHFVLPEKETSHQAKQQAVARENISKLNKRAAMFFHDYLNSDTPDGLAARQYLEERGVRPAIVRRFGLGLSPPGWDGLLSHFPDTEPVELEAAGLAVKNRKGGYYDRFRGRLMFPIIDHRSRVIGFGGRVLEGEPWSSISNDYRQKEAQAKYLNTPETPLFHKSKCLYGLNLAKKVRKDRLIVVEGYMDVMAMHQHGFTNTVGVLGTALGDSHNRVLRGVGCNAVTLILDSDDAGIRAAQRAIPVLTKGDINVKILSLPEAKDPDEYLNRFGAQSLANLLDSARSHIAFQVGLLRDKHDLTTMDGRVGFTQESAKVLAALPSAIEKDAYVNEVAAASNISSGAIHAEMAKISPVTQEGYRSPARNFRPRAKGEDIGLKNAKKGLLYLVFTYPTAAGALEKSGCLLPEEMTDIYGKLLGFAYENARNDKEIAPADIIDYFESEQEQQAIAEIFADSIQYPTVADVEKALNDMVRKIKLAWLMEQIEMKKTDVNAVNSLHFQIKNAAFLNITMADG